MMEIKNGEKTINVPGWVVAAGIATIGTIIADICKVRIANHKQVARERSLTQGLHFLYLLDIHLMSKTEDEYIEIVITELKGEVFL